VLQRGYLHILNLLAHLKCSLIGSFCPAHILTVIPGVMVPANVIDWM
jgi:hypothetical protein